MRFRSPVSRGSFALRFSAIDVLWAFVTPGLVLWIRGAQALSAPYATDLLIFWSVSFLAALAGFLAFRIRDGLTHLFSVHDALDVGKAVVLTELLTAFVMFTVARLNGIPRSILVIHALFLVAGLVAVRAAARMAHRESRPGRHVPRTEHVLFLGANKLTSLYIEFLRAFAPSRFEIVGILDNGSNMIGRSVAGVRVLGRTDHIVPLVREYMEHGVFISQVLVGSEPDALSDTERQEIEAACSSLEIGIKFIPALIGLQEIQSKLPETLLETRPAASITEPAKRRYEHSKRALDIVLGLGLIVLLAPVFPLVAALVFLDVGSPILFWQRRAGLNGRPFQVYKFRTLKPSYDRSGLPAADSRLSWAGRLLRLLRLDELPQLLNVIIGDMSLIGPRPLLPKDQPADPLVRLSVRPGITGWAQVNGGTLITAEKKNELDEWYVRNMSFRLDLAIVYRTLLVVLRGEDAPSNAFSQLKTDAEPPVAPLEEPASVPAE